MLKQTIKYKDFNDDDSVETLYFNVSKVELAENLDLRDEIKAIQDKFDFDGETRELVSDEIKMILSFVKRLMKLSYGERSADGKKFNKSERAWEDFRYSAIHDEYLLSLFEDPNKALAFIRGIMPAGLVEEAEALAAQQNGDQPQLPSEDVPDPVQEVKFEDPEPWITENREPTEKEMRHMTQDQMRRVIGRKLGAK